MKKYTLIIIMTLVISFGSFHFTHAQVKGKGQTAPGEIPNTKGQTAPGEIPNTKGQTAPGSINQPDPEKLDDPLGEGVSLEGLLLKLFDIILYVGVPVVAFFLIWSGFMFITAQGSPEKLETARSRLLYTVIGAILLLGAWTISQAIKGTLEDIKSGGTAMLSKDIFS